MGKIEGEMTLVTTTTTTTTVQCLKVLRIGELMSEDLNRGRERG